MKISIITICYNSVNTLERTINSVLKQKLLPAEYVFVDGGSNDGTLELLQEKKKELTATGIKVLIIKQKRVKGQAGIPSAWNQGLTKVTGDIIALLNSDDWYEQDILKKVQNSFKENPSVEAVVCPVQLWADNKVKKILAPRCFSLLPVLMPIPHPGTFFKQSLYKRIGHYNPKYQLSADYDFVWRCKQAKINWHLLATPLVNMEAGGRANSNRKIARNETLNIALKYKPYSITAYIAWLLRVLSKR